MKLKLSILFVLFFVLGFAQQGPYGNEWIVHTQQYYKIPVAEDGIYKVDSIDFVNAGIPIASIDPRSLQFFQRRKQLYVYVKGEQDGVMNTNDYVLFYAESNKGSHDSSLFDGNPFLANPYFSVINDTASVFVTWNSSLSNNRLSFGNDTNFTAYPASSFFVKKVVQAFRNEYHAGPQNAINATDPRYLHGEGMAKTPFTIGGNETFSFNTSSLYVGGPPSNFTISYGGSSRSANYAPDHDVVIDYKDNLGNWNNLGSNSYYGYRCYRPDFLLNNIFLGTNSEFRITSVNNPNYFNGNRTSVYYAQLIFPSTYDLNGANKQMLYILDEPGFTKSFLNITNYNDAGYPVWFFDITNNRVDTVVKQGANYKVLVPNSNGQKACLLTNEGEFKNVNKIIPVNGNGFFVNYTAMAVDSAYLIVSNSKFINASGLPQYIAYRSSPAGGSYSVVLANVQDLYDQFAYGVYHHPNSIRNFCKFVMDTFPSFPQNLFLVGKAVHAPTVLTDPSTYSKSYVCSMGYPSADNLFTRALAGSVYLDPAIPTGRLAAQSDSDVVNYLDKVLDYESQPDDVWKKNVLHFVGGTDASQQATFNYYMSTYKSVIEDTLFGGNVSTFYKTSTAPIGINTNDSIKDLIESGVSLLTFFGHGSYTGFEQNIDNPYSFNNKPRYPLMLANSCYTGDIHTKYNGHFSNSEKFVLAKDHGTVGFLASVSAGVSYALDLYTREFYKCLAYEKYGKTYGEIISKTVRNTLSQFISLQDSIVNITCLEMTLHGDPALRAPSFSAPDYQISNSDLKFDIQKNVDSIEVSLNMHNLARAVNDSFNIYFERILPDGDSVVYMKRIHAPYFFSNLTFNIDKEIIRSVGLNKFFVRVDHFSEISELSELNNTTSGYVNLFIPGGDIAPVYPYEFAIVPDLDSIVLQTSTADPFAPQQLYRLQLDTNDSFTSPLIDITKNSQGGVISWPVQLLNTDSTVYFWRVAKDTSNPSAFNWRESSFQTITNKYGWAQAHFHQYKNDQYQYVKYVKPARRFEFANDVKSIVCRDAFNTLYLDFALIGYSINNVQQNYWTCGGSGGGWTFAVFDSISGQPVFGDTTTFLPSGTWLSQYGSCVCTPEIRPAIDFGEWNYCGDSFYWRTRMENFINAIPNGKYVLAYSHANDSSSTWPASLYNAFQSFGSDSIQFKSDTVAMIIWGRKGAPVGSANQIIGKLKSDVLVLEDTIATNWNNGFIMSPEIGPATAWRSFHWRQNPFELPNKDSVFIRILGIDSLGQKVNLVDFNTSQLDISDLYNYVDINLYKKIQLVAYMEDDSSHTPPQMDRWQVIFDPVPEAALAPSLGFALSKNITAEGDQVVIKMPIKNISNLPFTDSLVVSYWIEDNNKVNHPLPDKLKLKPFQPDSVFIDTIAFSTLGYPGLNALWIDVNAPGNLKYQNEQYHFNNIARIPFQVSRDVINPLLDVTFDGIHILNGDIVSAKPLILVSLKDENKFLALNDTGDFTLYLKYPGAPTETRIYFNQNLLFTPAQLPNNSCKIEFNPNLLQDGRYELLVQAKDRSDNESGSINYRIQFDIINKASITEVLNYPNPFSTSTRFVFTLTGSEIPETFKIQILTISGKVIREIHKEELGIIRIGRNITDYAWDGKDMFGDQLANGVYLYRVVTRLKGEEIEKRESGADSYITKGFGKMVLIR